MSHVGRKPQQSHLSHGEAESELCRRWLERTIVNCYDLNLTFSILKALGQLANQSLKRLPIVEYRRDDRQSEHQLVSQLWRRVNDGEAAETQDGAPGLGFTCRPNDDRSIDLRFSSPFRKAPAVIGICVPTPDLALLRASPLSAHGDGRFGWG